MPYVAPIVAVIDRTGNLWCIPCAEENQVAAEAEWPSDNSALDGATPCRGCRTRVPYDPKATVWVP